MGLKMAGGSTSMSPAKGIVGVSSMMIYMATGSIIFLVELNMRATGVLESSRESVF